MTQFPLHERIEAIAVVFVAPWTAAIGAGWLASVLLGDGPISLGAAMVAFWATLVPLYNWRRRAKAK